MVWLMADPDPVWKYYPPRTRPPEWVPAVAAVFLPREIAKARARRTTAIVAAAADG
jgi:hypothetical protein